MNRTSIKKKFGRTKLNNKSKMVLLGESKLNDQFPHMYIPWTGWDRIVWYDVHVDSECRIFYYLVLRKFGSISSIYCMLSNRRSLNMFVGWIPAWVHHFSLFFFLTTIHGPYVRLGSTIILLLALELIPMPHIRPRVKCRFARESQGSLERTHILEWPKAPETMLTRASIVFASTCQAVNCLGSLQFSSPFCFLPLAPCQPEFPA